MTKSQKTSEKFTGVKAKLAKSKAEKSAQFETETLPVSGVDVSIPQFIDHGAWMIAQRQAKGDVPTAQTAFVAQVVKFEGEKLTLADIRELCDAKDILFLISKVFGDEEDEGKEEAG